MRFADISIRAKLLVAFALMLAAAVTMIATLYAELVDFSRTARLNTQSKDLIRLTHVAEKGLIRMNSQMRAVMLTGSYTYLDTYFEGRAQFDDGTRQLLAMPLDPGQRALVRVTRRKGQEWQRLYSAPLIRLARHPRGAETAARALLAAGWRARVTHITRGLADVRDAEETRMQALQGQQDADVVHCFIALGVGGVLLLSIAAAMSRLLARSIARPIHAMTTTMTRLADGDYATPIAGLRRRDEIGRMADTLAIFHANGVARAMLEAETRRLTAEADAEHARIAAQDRARAGEDRLTLSNVGEALALVARGDLTHRLHGRLPPRALPLERDFDVAMAKLGQTLRGVRDAVLTLDGSAGQLAGMSEQLSARTDHQAMRLTAMTRSIGELKETVARNAGHARRAADVTATARSLAERSSAVMVDTRAAMDRLETNADRVSGVADVIGTISKQTGLLALNAMLEAARAGPAGAGFAVVATEVKSLAARAETAAREIRAILAAATADAATGVELVRGCDAMLQGIIGEVVEVARLTGDIATTAQAQATEIAAVNTVAEQIDGMTREHAAMAIDTRACCGRLADEAQGLRDMVGWLAIDAAPLPDRTVALRAAA